jgi:hypothetical protein
MSFIAPSQGVRRWNHQTSYFQRGTNPVERWYALGVQNQTAFSILAVTSNNLRARPFSISKPITLDRLSFEVTTGGGAGSKARCGLYNATSLKNLYPSSLIVDGNEFDTTVGNEGNKASTIAVTLSPGTYWFAYLAGTTGPSVRTLSAGGREASGMAVDNTLSQMWLQIVLSFTYAALPSTFPGGATAEVSASRMPVIFGRASA